MHANMRGGKRRAGMHARHWRGAEGEGVPDAVVLPNGAVAPNGEDAALPNAGVVEPNAGAGAPKGVPPKVDTLLPKAGLTPKAGDEAPKAGLEAAPNIEGAEMPPKGVAACCWAGTPIPASAPACCP